MTELLFHTGSDHCRKRQTGLKLETKQWQLFTNGFRHYLREARKTQTALKKIPQNDCNHIRQFYSNSKPPQERKKNPVHIITQRKARLQFYKHTQLQITKCVIFQNKVLKKTDGSGHINHEAAKLLIFEILRFFDHSTLSAHG